MSPLLGRYLQAALAVAQAVVVGVVRIAWAAGPVATVGPIHKPPVTGSASVHSRGRRPDRRSAARSRGCRRADCSVLHWRAWRRHLRPRSPRPARRGPRRRAAQHPVHGARRHDDQITDPRAFEPLGQVGWHLLAPARDQRQRHQAPPVDGFPGLLFHLWVQEPDDAGSGTAGRSRCSPRPVRGARLCQPTTPGPRRSGRRRRADDRPDQGRARRSTAPARQHPVRRSDGGRQDPLRPAAG